MAKTILGKLHSVVLPTFSNGEANLDVEEVCGLASKLLSEKPRAYGLLYLAYYWGEDRDSLIRAEYLHSKLNNSFY